MTDDEYTAQPCPAAAWGGHDGHGEIGDCRIVVSWRGRGLGNRRPNQEPTPAVLSEAHTRDREFSNTLSDEDVTSDIPLPPQPVRVESNVPMTKLAPGEKPPQFVLFSFDGVGLTPNWDMFLDTAQRVDARFSALMTGLYFLTDDNAGHYQGPGHLAGKAAIAFGGDKEDVLEQIGYLNRTWLAGHEMGTHYVGHFCKGSGSHGAQWTSSEWTHELNEFFSLMANWRSNNDITAGPDLLFDPEEVRGGRTQCLEGALDQMIPAWHEFGMTWDSSKPASHAGISWPYKVDGIWEFPIPYVYSPPLGKHQTALDYNFWYTLNGAKNDPATTRRGHDIAKGTYDYMFDQHTRVIGLRW